MNISPLRNSFISIGSKTPLSSEQDTPKDLEKLREACEDFESIFAYQMLKEMRKTLNKNTLVNGGQAEEIFSDMLTQERAKTAKLGLADLLFSQLKPKTSSQEPKL